MKKIILFLFLSFGVFILMQSQTIDDQSKVLQKCIDLPEMQEYYPNLVDENLKIIYIMQYPVVFSSDISVFKFNKKVEFKSRQLIYTAKANCFFLFKTFVISNEIASAEFSYYYDYTISKKLIEGKVILEKVDGSWIIKDSKIERK